MFTYIQSITCGKYIYIYKNKQDNYRLFINIIMEKQANKNEINLNK